MNTPRLIVCMGVSGTGKSTCARELADKFDLVWVEADGFHSAKNIKKMRNGESLTDSDRQPWMDDLCAHLSDRLFAGRDCVLSHSALRRKHRNRIRAVGFRTLFLHLDCRQDLIAQRLADRRDHFMPASLLESQIATLEYASDAETDVVRIDASTDKSTVFSHLATIVDRFLTKESVNVARSAR